MDTMDEIRAALSAATVDTALSLAAAAAARVVPIYEGAGDGDPEVLRRAVQHVGEASGDDAETERLAALLEEYSDAAYAEEDHLMAAVVDAVLSALKALQSQGAKDECHTAVAQTLLGVAEVADSVDGTLEDAGEEPIADDEEAAWRARAVGLASANTDDDAMRALPAPSWLASFMTVYLEP